MSHSEFGGIVDEFIAESFENLDHVDRALVELEQRSDPATLAATFRAVHTMKGTSSFLGFSMLESITHVGENLLSGLRDGNMAMSTEIADALLAMVDAVRSILDSVESTGQEPTTTYSDLVAELGRLGAKPCSSGPTEARQLSSALEAHVEGDPHRVGDPLVERDAIQPKDVIHSLVDPNNGYPPATRSIRVDVRLLDDLMNSVGELVLARNEISRVTDTNDDPALLAATQRLTLVTSELQESVMRARMQPIENVWNKFPRIVRELTIPFGKRARLEMEGQRLELDKLLLEAIKDPLTHLVRNAVDHGLETVEARLAAGKPAEGVVTLRARHEGAVVVVEIGDDGAGIQPDRIRHMAVQNGMLSSDEAAASDDRDIVNLIFQPGLSTAATITRVSGRGVGLDVVRTNIENVGGSVDVHSTSGTGTTFTVKIPLTDAVVDLPTSVRSAPRGCTSRRGVTGTLPR